MSWFRKLFGEKKKEEDPTEIAEREGEMLDKLAGYVSRFGMEEVALLFIESVQPLTNIGSQLILIPAAPFLEVFGVRGFDYASLFQKRENVTKLLEKIEANLDKRIGRSKKRKT